MDAKRDYEDLENSPWEEDMDRQGLRVRAQRISRVLSQRNKAQARYNKEWRKLKQKDKVTVIDNWDIEQAAKLKSDGWTGEVEIHPALGDGAQDLLQSARELGLDVVDMP